jgi:hypothetical protein
MDDRFARTRDAHPADEIQKMSNAVVSSLVLGYEVADRPSRRSRRSSLVPPSSLFGVHRVRQATAVTLIR